MGTLVASNLQMGKRRLEEMMHLAQVLHQVSWGWECELKIISQPLLTTLQACVPPGVPMGCDTGSLGSKCVSSMPPSGYRALSPSACPALGPGKWRQLSPLPWGQEDNEPGGVCKWPSWVLSLIFTVTWAIARYRSSYGLSVYPKIPLLKS